MTTTVMMGPILYFAGANASEWRFNVRLLVRADSQAEALGSELKIVSDSANDPDSIDVGACTMHHSFADIDKHYWIGWQVRAKRKRTDRVLAYRYTVNARGEDVSDVVVPAEGALPRIAFYSCNGAGDDRKFHELDEPYGLWERMRALHLAGITAPDPDNPSAFHLLIGGGDQVYADSVWDVAPLKEYKPKSKADRKKVRPGAAFRKQLEKVYLKLYRDRWSRDAVAAIKRRVPGIFTWDDHDIFDGWGSHEDDLTNCPLYQAIFLAANRMFRAFQIGGDRANLLVSTNGHALQATRIENQDSELGLLFLDTRTDRRRERILAEEQWQDAIQWLDVFQRDRSKPRHLLVISAVPVLYLRFHLEKLPAGGVEDDRRDGWEHRDHRGERTRLIMTLLSHARAAGCQTTILSGDVHVAAHGRIVSQAPEHVSPGQRQVIIHQLTSSAIGHPEPGWFEWLAIQAFTSDDPEQVADDVRTEIVSMTRTERYIRARNFLVLAFDNSKQVEGAKRMWAQWYTEKYNRLSQQQVIHAYQPTPET